MGTQRKETKLPLEPSHWVHEIFYFQNGLSPFSTWTNTPIINLGYLLALPTTARILCLDSL
jgi:hypothetical protein